MIIFHGRFLSYLQYDNIYDVIMPADLPAKVPYMVSFVSSNTDLCAIFVVVLYMVICYIVGYL